VRTLPVGVVVSAAAHIVAALWFGVSGVTDEPAAEPEPVTIDLVPAPPPPPPADVAMIDGDGAGATTSAAPGRAPIARGHAAIASSGRGTNEVAPGPTSPLMRMRGNGVDLRHLKWTPSFDPDAVPLAPPVQVAALAVAAKAPEVRPDPPSPPIAPDQAVAAPADSAAERACRISIGSQPWSEVWIDGKSTGRHTPLVNYKIACGRRTLTLKNAELALAKSVVVTLKPRSRLRKVVRLAEPDAQDPQ